MFNINPAEAAVIAVIFLLVFGPDRLPEMALQLGKLVSQIRQAIDEAGGDITRELEAAAREARELEALEKREKWKAAAKADAESRQIAPPRPSEADTQVQTTGEAATSEPDAQVQTTGEAATLDADAQVEPTAGVAAPDAVPDAATADADIPAAEGPGAAPPDTDSGGSLSADKDEEP